MGLCVGVHKGLSIIVLVFYTSHILYTTRLSVGTIN